MVQRPSRRWFKHTRRGCIRRGVLALDEAPFAERCVQQRDATSGDGFFKLRSQGLGFRPLNDRTKIQVGQSIGVVFYCARVPELERRHHGVIHFKKLRQQSSLHHVTRIRSTTLFGVGKTFLQVSSQVIPLRIVPHTPRV